MSNGENYIFPHTNLLDLTLFQYGIDTCSPLQLFGPAIRNHYLIHFILKGQGTYLVSNKIHSLKEGEAFLITPGVPTTYYAHEKDPWTYIWVEFDGLKAAEYLKQAGLSLDNPIYRPHFQSVPSAKPPFQLANEILLEHDNTALFQISNLYLLLDSLIKHSNTEKEKHPSTLKDFYMKEAVHYIENHYAEDISIQDLAAWCNLNRSYFSKLFKDSLKITPQEFLMRYRMNQACELLSRTNTPINQIAGLVGYPIPLHFSRAFKKMYECSPRAWRNDHKL